MVSTGRPVTPAGASVFAGRARRGAHSARERVRRSRPAKRRRKRAWGAQSFVLWRGHPVLMEGCGCCCCDSAGRRQHLALWLVARAVVAAALRHRMGHAVMLCWIGTRWQRWESSPGPQSRSGVQRRDARCAVRCGVGWERCWAWCLTGGRRCPREAARAQRALGGTRFVRARRRCRGPGCSPCLRAWSVQRRVAAGEAGAQDGPWPSRQRAVRHLVARAVPAVALCLRIGDAMLPSRVGARRSRWRSLPRLWGRWSAGRRGRGGPGSVGCRLDRYGNGRGSGWG